VSANRSFKALAEAYGEQLDDIGQMLVQAGILTAGAVQRQGVRFALRDQLESQTATTYFRGSLPDTKPLSRSKACTRGSPHCRRKS
jgi:hypothetical protein